MRPPVGVRALGLPPTWIMWALVEDQPDNSGLMDGQILNCTAKEVPLWIGVELLGGKAYEV